MTVSPQLVEALAEVISKHGNNGLRRLEHEDPRDYVARVLPSIDGDIRKSRPLSPLQVALYDMPKNALLAAASDLDWNEKDLKELKKVDRFEIAERLHRAYGGKDEEAMRVFVNRIFASRSSITLCKLAKAPTAGQLRYHLKLVYKRDIFEEKHMHRAVGSAYEITAATEIDEHRYCVSLSKAIEAKEAIGNDFRVTTLTSLYTVHVVIDSKTETLEFRGPNSEVERAVRALLDELGKGGYKCSYGLVEITQADADRLQTGLSADLKSARHVDESGRQSGVRFIHATIDRDFVDSDGRNDLTKAPGYQKLLSSFGEDVFQHDVELSFLYDGKPYAMQIHLAGGSLRFPEGVVTEDVVNHVMVKLKRILKLAK